MTRGWRAYRDAVTAAAVAHGVLGAAQTAQMTTGAASLGLGGLLAKGAGSLAKFGPLAIPVGAAYLSYRHLKGIRPGQIAASEAADRARWQDQIGTITASQQGASTAATLHGVEREANWIYSLQRAEADAHKRGLSGSQYARFTTEAALKEARSDYATAKARRNELWGGVSPGPMQRITVAERWGVDPHAASTWQDPEHVARYTEATRGIDVVKVKEQYAQAQQDMLRAKKQELELEQRRLEINRQITRESAQGVQATLQGLRQQLDVEKQKIQTVRDAALTAKQRFGMASPVEQRRQLAVKAKADRGEALTRDEARLMQGMGTMATGDIYAREAGRFAEAGGWAGGKFDVGEQAAGMKAARAAGGAIGRAYAIETVHKVMVEFGVEVSEQSLQRAFERVSGPLARKINDMTIGNAERAVDAQLTQDAQTRASQEAADRGD